MNHDTAIEGTRGEEDSKLGMRPGDLKDGSLVSGQGGANFVIGLADIVDLYGTICGDGLMIRVRQTSERTIQCLGKSRSVAVVVVAEAQRDQKEGRLARTGTARGHFGSVEIHLHIMDQIFVLRINVQGGIVRSGRIRRGGCRRRRRHGPVVDAIHPVLLAAVQITLEPKHFRVLFMRDPMALSQSRLTLSSARQQETSLKYG
jgi:hypothetical protein